MKKGRLELRLSLEEKDNLIEICKKLNCTYSQYFVSRIKNDLDFGSKNRIFEFIRKDEAFYSKVENNINQVARIVNTEKQISNATLEDFNSLLRELISIKNEQLNKTTKIYLEVTK